MRQKGRTEMLSVGELIAQFTSAVRRDVAALFVGAGLSKPGGFVNWSELMKDYAKAIGLDAEAETDLIAVAQYYLNEKRQRGRTTLNRRLQAEFARPGHLTENHRLIARLPVRTIWTTNFDSLIESGFEAEGKGLRVVRRDGEIPPRGSMAQRTLFKMHGDHLEPKRIIICKEDYERYAREHGGFQSALQDHLLEKEFLFLGYSLRDPNLNYMLSHMRILMERNCPGHYALMRRERDNSYEENKQRLFVQDLQRYGIRVALFEDFAQITDALREVERKTRQYRVFISGSATCFDEISGQKLGSVCRELAYRLIKAEHDVVTGFGRFVGGSVVEGAVSALQEAGADVDWCKRLHLHPFPQGNGAGKHVPFNKSDYRDRMIRDCGFAVFLAGNKEGHPISPGVIEEFGLAEKHGLVPIPVGATGSAAGELWKRVSADPGRYYGATLHGEVLRMLNRKTSSVDTIVGAVLEIIRTVHTL